MAVQVTILANASNEYRVIVEIAERQFEVVIDTGFTNPLCQVGLALDNNSYQAVQTELHDLLEAELYPVGEPTPVRVDSGIGVVNIFGLDNSEVLTRVVNAGENILGVCYFHGLADFEVSWNLAEKAMTIGRQR
ncbi:MAG: hypothetical protein EXR50_01900 [Dehalococcoidia bacterium]|nr:hypothetical protein [Dehalococcoidia bacterium]